MKSLRITLISLALALFIAGCAGGTGASNFDTTKPFYSEVEAGGNM